MYVPLFVDTCNVHPSFKHLIDHCNGPYSVFNEDKRWFKPGWQSPYKKKGEQKRRFSPWKYATGSESRNMIPIMATFNTYLGGGYLGELGINKDFSQMYAKYMIKHNWVDQNTRVVFLEFTLYNPNVNLVSVGTIMFEFMNFGGVFHRLEIYVSRLYRTLLAEHMIFIACDVVLFFYIFVSLYREGKRMKQQKSAYFKSLNNLSNLILVLLGIALIGIYILRAFSLDTKIDDYRKNPDLFHSFYQNAMYHEMVAYLMSFIDFVAILKFLTFLTFNRDFMILIGTVVRAGPKVLYFLIFITLQLVSFVFFSFLLFGASKFNFSSFQRSLYSLNLLLLGVFEFSDYQVVPVLGPLLFMTYSIMMTFMLMNIFMTILIEVYAEVKNDEELRKKEFKLVEFLIQCIKIKLGITEPPSGINEDEDEQTNPNKKRRKKDPYIHRLNKTIRSFEYRNTPKMVRLINRIYIDDFMEDLDIMILLLSKSPQEFLMLMPCAQKINLENMLRKGEIDIETYYEKMIFNSDRSSEYYLTKSQPQINTERLYSKVCEHAATVTALSEPNLNITTSTTRSRSFQYPDKVAKQDEKVWVKRINTLDSHAVSNMPIKSNGYTSDEENLSDDLSSVYYSSSSGNAFTLSDDADSIPGITTINDVYDHLEQTTQEDMNRTATTPLKREKHLPLWERQPFFKESIPETPKNITDEEKFWMRSLQPHPVYESSSIVRKTTSTAQKQSFSYLTRKVPYKENGNYFDPNVDIYLTDLEYKENSMASIEFRRYNSQTHPQSHAIDMETARRLSQPLETTSFVSDRRDARATYSSQNNEPHSLNTNRIGRAKKYMSNT